MMEHLIGIDMTAKKHLEVEEGLQGAYVKHHLSGFFFNQTLSLRDRHGRQHSRQLQHLHNPHEHQARIIHLGANQCRLLCSTMSHGPLCR